MKIPIKHISYKILFLFKRDKNRHWKKRLERECYKVFDKRLDEFKKSSKFDKEFEVIK